MMASAQTRFGSCFWNHEQSNIKYKDKIQGFFTFGFAQDQNDGSVVTVAI
jgi:hypothetical protein